MRIHCHHFFAMPGRQCNEGERGVAVGRYLAGESVVTIAADFLVDPATVYRWAKIYNDRGSLVRLPCSGRPRCTTEAEDQLLQEHVKGVKFTTSKLSVLSTGFPASLSTARRRIAEIGLKPHRAAVAEVLTDEHKGRRVAWANLHLNFDQGFWDQVVFSDEKVFQSVPDGPRLVYRPKKARYDPAYVYTMKRSGRVTVNVWVCVLRSGHTLIRCAMNSGLMLLACGLLAITMITERRTMLTATE